MQTQPKYEIRVKGHLDERWMRYFEGLEILPHPDGESTITGLLEQASLHGILNRIRDLGLELISVQRDPTEKQRKRS